ncbi:uncharacterized protein AB675_7288 [Cyphellophora attinorum]|uniref:Uncharacterized protein n=1 Tax=Cyphellophora attinorum TaxID=1664694 RepID=A0A0N1H4M7_9EURO|nr:uncharacterized protein AB675_7288 [Phialophora attinorum]KPI36305.1 hypothetical protein AB675_7288 [Phialophora attinorum]
MPSKKTAQNHDYTPEAFTEPPTDLLDPEPVPRSSRKKSKHAKRVTETAFDEIASERSPSPPPVPPIPEAHRRQHAPDELTAAEKVSDDHTPPQANYAQPIAYGRSPPVELLPGFTHRPSPPVQTYIGGGGFNTRSPPTSPPQTKARPVSYGGPPSTVGYPRTSTSPYAYPSSAFGSPPPHMPQAHFYHARDIDLGLGQRYNENQAPTFVKFSKVPGRKDAKTAVLVGTEDSLHVLAYRGDKLSRLGCLAGLPGVVHDAFILTWSQGHDPFHALRPLVALTLHGISNAEAPDQRRFSNTSRRASVMTQRPDIASAASTTVVVYSLKEQAMLSTLLHVPSGASQQIPTWMDRQTSQLPTGRLRLQASGNHLVVSSGISGEAYIFGVREVNDQPHFVCLDKLWTTLQPRMRRRDSSHTRPGEPAVSPADLASSIDNGEQPIISINGRWLAYCPVLSSRPSLGALLGENVLCSSSPSITSRSAPARPAATCAVDSPDVETMLGRVAKGVAQEVLKGGKWLGEKGVQAWQSYWAQDTPNKASPSPSPIYSPQQNPSFPPTHGDTTEAISKESEIVTIVDLHHLDNQEAKRSNVSAVSTFQPPGGCSYLSFAPNGLTLLTASRKGNIYYVWDLLQTRYPRHTLGSGEAESFAKVRQIAKNERFSESIIVDIQWEAPVGSRYAVLTHNQTVHMLDIPVSAWRWPPPRARKKKRPVSVPADTVTSTQQASGFLSSAMNFANSRAQPMLANLRGRTPSMGMPSGIGNTGLGLASATGLRGGKVVAAGFSKSLGAASDTVANIRHAGQSKLHLKVEAIPGRLAWTYRDQRPRLSILDMNEVRSYYVRKTNPRDRQPETVSVFDSRRVVSVKLAEIAKDEEPAEENLAGFWRSEIPRRPSAVSAAPLSFAEIDTNAPYQPFHSHHRVTISIFADDAAASELPSVSAKFDGGSAASKCAPANDKWLFGQDIATTRLSSPSPPHDAYGAVDEPRQQGAVYRETTIQPAEFEGERNQIVSTTRRKKSNKGREDVDQLASPMAEGIGESDNGFFENDVDVLDVTQDRV